MCFFSRCCRGRPPPQSRAPPLLLLSRQPPPPRPQQRPLRSQKALRRWQPPPPGGPGQPDKGRMPRRKRLRQAPPPGGIAAAREAPSRPLRRATPACAACIPIRFNLGGGGGDSVAPGLQRGSSIESRTAGCAAGFFGCRVSLAAGFPWSPGFLGSRVGSGGGSSLEGHSAAHERHGHRPVVARVGGVGHVVPLEPHVPSGHLASSDGRQLSDIRYPIRYPASDHSISDHSVSNIRCPYPTIRYPISGSGIRYHGSDAVRFRV